MDYVSTDYVSTPEIEPLIVKDIVHAPIIYFESAPNFGNANGIVNVTLAVDRHMPDGTQIASDTIAVASLRCNVQAAIELRNALDRALLLAPSTEAGVN